MSQDNLVLRVLSSDEQDGEELAQRLRAQLGEEGVVQVTAEAAPPLPGRGVEPLASMQVINLGLSVVVAAATVAQTLNGFRKDRPAAQIVISNAGSGRGIQIHSEDSVEIIEAKLKKVGKKRGFLNRLLGGR